MAIYIEVVIEKKNGHGPARRIRASVKNIAEQIDNLRNNEIIRHFDIIEHTVLAEYSFARRGELDARKVLDEVVEAFVLRDEQLNPVNWEPLGPEGEKLDDED